MGGYLQIVLIDQALKDTDGRNAVLNRILEQSENDSRCIGMDNKSEYIEIAKLMRDGGDKPIDKADIEKILQTTPAAEKVGVLYVAGRQRQLLGDRQGAVEFYNRCVAIRTSSSLAYNLAYIQLRALGEDPVAPWKSAATTQPSL